LPKYIEFTKIIIFAIPEPAKPLNDAQMCGSFFLPQLMTIKATPFTESYKNVHDLVQLLRIRGLCISNQQQAERYLSTIGYYRLSAYLIPLLQMPKSEKHFKIGASFNQAMMLYRFDKKLRMLIFNEIEKVEVAIRATIVNTICEMTGDKFWITNPIHFADKVKFSNTISLIIKEIRHSHEEFITKFRTNYTDPFPPVWMLAEILPFGCITNIFSNLKDNKLKKKVSQQFGLQVPPFESWMTKLYLTRNDCAHHARIWNKRNTMNPTIPNRMTRPWITLPTDTLKVYHDICIIKYLLNVVNPNNDMLAKLHCLLFDFPEVDIAAMGFPIDWKSEPLWQ